MMIIQEDLSSNMLIEVLQTRCDLLNEEMAALLIVETGLCVRKGILQRHVVINFTRSHINQHLDSVHCVQNLHLLTSFYHLVGIISLVQVQMACVKRCKALWVDAIRVQCLGVPFNEVGNNIVSTVEATYEHPCLLI